jgi:hypothetical protein
LSSWHKQPSEISTCNPNADGCAWAACGKSLVSKQTALGTQDPSVKKCAGSVMTRFPTGCAGSWKTLVSPRWRQSHGDARAKESLTGSNDEFPTALASRPRHSATTTGVRLQLSKFRAGGAYRPSSDYWPATVLRHRSYRPKVFNQAAPAPSRMPRDDFSAWAFLIVVNVHF